MRTVRCRGLLGGGEGGGGGRGGGGVCMGGGVCLWGCTPPPNCGQKDGCLWKHNLSATTVADGNNTKFWMSVSWFTRYEIKWQTSYIW